MSETTGKIQRVKNREGGFSLQLDDGNWYGFFGSPKDWMKEGATIWIDYTKKEKDDGDGYWRNVQDFEKKSEGTQTTTSDYSNGNDYQKRQEKKQGSIRRQVALKCAVQLSEDMTQNEAVTAFHKFDELLKEGELKDA